MVVVTVADGIQGRNPGCKLDSSVGEVAHGVFRIAVRVKPLPGNGM